MRWCESCWRERRRWLPCLVAVGLSAFYIILLIFYWNKSTATLKVSQMIRAEKCVINNVGHKSSSKKVTLCCKERLGVLCKLTNYMPCSSISVQYQLPGEEFIRAGYLNYWNPQQLRFRYATNSHCMIVPITCPEPEDEWKYTMEHIYPQYNLDQELTCYVYSDIPETPLLIKAEVFSHISLALMILTMPPLAILAAFTICYVVRPKNSDKGHPEKSSDRSCDRSCDKPLMPKR